MAIRGSVELAAKTVMSTRLRKRYNLFYVGSILEVVVERRREEMSCLLLECGSLWY